MCGGGGRGVQTRCNMKIGLDRISALLCVYHVFTTIRKILVQ